jgi:hypothetical protein
MHLRDEGRTGGGRQGGQRRGNQHRGDEDGGVPWREPCPCEDRGQDEGRPGEHALGHVVGAEDRHRHRGEQRKEEPAQQHQRPVRPHRGGRQQGDQERDPAEQQVAAEGRVGVEHVEPGLDLVAEAHPHEAVAHRLAVEEARGEIRHQRGGEDGDLAREAPHRPPRRVRRCREQRDEADGQAVEPEGEEVDEGDGEAGRDVGRETPPRGRVQHPHPERHPPDREPHGEDEVHEPPGEGHGIDRHRREQAGRPDPPGPRALQRHDAGQAQQDAGEEERLGRRLHADEQGQRRDREVHREVRRRAEPDLVDRGQERVRVAPGQHRHPGQMVGVVHRPGDRRQGIGKKSQGERK